MSEKIFITVMGFFLLSRKDPSAFAELGKMGLIYSEKRLDKTDKEDIIER